MAQLIVLTIASAVLVAAIVLHGIDVFWSRRLMVRKRVLVSLRSGNALTGVLWQRRGRLLVLKSASLHEPGAAPAVIDGDVVVDRAQVEHVQVAPAQVT